MPGQTKTAPQQRIRHPGGPGERPRMWRAAWRQHRLWVIGTVALVAIGGAVLGLIAVVTPACASTAYWEVPGATCNVEPAATLWRLFRLAFLGLPILAGVVLGALTFGPDVEHRTQVYALTQGVSRFRWWTAKVVTMSLPVFTAAALLGMATLWIVNAHVNPVISTVRLTTPGFDVLGLIPATRFLVAYAAAAAAALIWRTVGGIVTGLVVAGVVVIGATMLQPTVVPHSRELLPVQAWLDGQSQPSMTDVNSAYESGGYTDAAGRDIDSSHWNCGQDFAACVRANGVVYRLETYVPDSQYPRMMLTISALNLLIAGAFLGIGARRLRRQDL
jgi:hypothetical protein